MIIQARRMYRAHGTTMPAYNGYGPAPLDVLHRKPAHQDPTMRIMAWSVMMLMIALIVAAIIFSYLMLVHFYGEVYMQ